MQKTKTSVVASTGRENVNQGGTKIKHFILTPDVLKHDPTSFKKFTGNHVYILSQVMEELEGVINSPKKNDIAIFQAKEAIKKLSEAINGNVKEAISPEGLLLKDSEVTLHIVKCSSFSMSKNNFIIFARDLKEKFPNEDTEVIIVSKSINTRLQCEFDDITAQDYENDKVLEEEIALFFQKVVISDEKYAQMMQDISALTPEDLNVKLFPNCFLEIFCQSDESVPYYVRYDGKSFMPLPRKMPMFAGIKPRNLGQQFVFDLIKDDDVELLTVTGGAGSGKTILSISAALQLVLKDRKYEKIIYVKPTIPADDGQGYIKGDLYDKLRPYMMSFFDSLSVILSDKEISNTYYKPFMNTTKAGENEPVDIERFVKTLIDRQILELTCFSYMRGRNIRNSVVIVDEGQQTTPFIAKLMLTRSSEKVKFIFIGDPSDNQIDSISVDPRSNGLVYIASKFKNSSSAGHVSLTAIERGNLAELADKLL